MSLVIIETVHLLSLTFHGLLYLKTGQMACVLLAERM